MVHTYQVTGMTCNGCEAKVKSALLTIENVTEVIASNIVRDSQLFTPISGITNLCSNLIKFTYEKNYCS